MLLSKSELKQRYALLPLEGRTGKGRHTIGRGKHGVAKRAKVLNGSHPFVDEVVIKSQPIKNFCQTAVTSAVIHRTAAYREAALHWQLADVPHLIRLYDVAAGKGVKSPATKVFMVLERGRPLRPLSREAARKAIEDILICLHALHERGVYHRDIVSTTPGKTSVECANVVAVGGCAKVIDLGKAAVKPPFPLRPIFAFADARAVARLYRSMLRSVDPPGAEAFWHWWMEQPTFSIERLSSHPDWAKTFNKRPVPTRGGWRGWLTSIWGRCRFWLFSLLEILTARWPLPRNPRVNPNPQPV